MQIPKRVATVMAPVAGMTMLVVGPTGAGAATDRVIASETHEFVGFTDTEPAYSFTCDIEVTFDWDTVTHSAAVWTISRGDPECTDTSNIAVVEATYVDQDGDRRNVAATGRGGYAALGIDDVGSDLHTTHWVKYGHANTTSPEYELPASSK